MSVPLQCLLFSCDSADLLRRKRLFRFSRVKRPIFEINLKTNRFPPPVLVRVCVFFCYAEQRSNGFYIESLILPDLQYQITCFDRFELMLKCLFSPCCRIKANHPDNDINPPRLLHAFSKAFDGKFMGGPKPFTRTVLLLPRRTEHNFFD